MLELLTALVLTIKGVSFYFFNKILFSPKKSVITRLLTYLLALFVLLLFHDTGSFQRIIFNLALFFISNIVILGFLYKVTPISAFLHASLLSGLSVISEILIGYIYGLFHENYWNEWKSVSRITVLLLSSIVFSFLTIFVAVIERKIKSIETTNASTNLIAFLTTVTLAMIVLSLLFDFYLFPNTQIEIRRLRIFIVIGLNVLLFGFVFLHFFFYKSEIENIVRKQKEKVETARSDFYSQLLQRDNEQRMLIHDIKKHLNALMRMSQEHNDIEMEKYLSNLVSESLLNSPIRYCNDDYIDSIIFYYQKEAEKHGIEFNVDANPTDFSFVDRHDITVIIYNLLDNSIESALNCSNSYINITFAKDVEKDICMIKIVNAD